MLDMKANTPMIEVLIKLNTLIHSLVIDDMYSLVARVCLDHGKFSPKRQAGISVFDRYDAYMK